jgi:hypothetical protein
MRVWQLEPQSEDAGGRWRGRDRAVARVRVGVPGATTAIEYPRRQAPGLGLEEWMTRSERKPAPSGWEDVKNTVA